MGNITIIGSGYIGLVIGNCLANEGNKVIFADIDQQKINKLKNGIIPIYEPGLEELLNKNLINNTVEFTTDVSYAIKKSPMIFIAVNTPTGKDGRADLTAVKNVAHEIGKNINEEKIICIKSTVPIGTHKMMQEIIQKFNNSNKFEIASIPEFLREGSAINDFLYPDRIVIGTKSDKVFETLKKLFSFINCDDAKIIFTNNMSAETVKYVSNSFLALKVSFINEVANLCDAMDVDAISVAHAVGLDKRIGSQFLKPGPGFGGSCFPKDILELMQISLDYKTPLKSLAATLEINEKQKLIVVQKIKNLLNNNIQGKTIGILGLAFKANTDDIRQSPAIEIISNLLKSQAKIKVYDPKAMANMKAEFPEIEYCADAYGVATSADILVVLTEWPEFSKLDFAKINKLMKSPIILDTRNILDIELLKAIGFMVDAIGRTSLCKNIANYKSEPVISEFKI